MWIAFLLCSFPPCQICSGWTCKASRTRTCTTSQESSDAQLRTRYPLLGADVVHRSGQDKCCGNVDWLAPFFLQLPAPRRFFADMGATIWSRRPISQRCPVARHRCATSSGSTVDSCNEDLLHFLRVPAPLQTFVYEFGCGHISYCIVSMFGIARSNRRRPPCKTFSSSVLTSEMNSCRTRTTTSPCRPLSRAWPSFQRLARPHRRALSRACGLVASLHLIHCDVVFDSIRQTLDLPSPPPPVIRARPSHVCARSS